MYRKTEVLAVHGANIMKKKEFTKHHDLRIRLLEGGKYELCWIDNKLTHLGFKKINNIDEYLSECKS